MDTQNLFVYGTLTFDGVLKSLLGRLPEKEPAQVEGFEVVTIHLEGWQPFPVMMKYKPNPGIIKKVDGYILKNLTDIDFEILDRYEYVYKDYYTKQKLKTMCGKSAHYYDPANSLLKIGTLGKPWDLNELDPLLETKYVDSVVPNFKKEHPDLFM